MLLVPSRGWSFFLSSVVDVAQFGLLGPFFRGQWIERLEVEFSAASAVVGFMGAVLTTSDNASVESWGSGQPVLQRSGLFGDGQPIMGMACDASRMHRLVWPVGVLVREGPVYIVGRAANSSAVSGITVTFCAFCLELRAEVVESGSERGDDT